MELKGVRGRDIYARYRALGGDPTYIRGQLYFSARVQGELHPHPSTRDAINDSDDSDPDGEREDAAVGGGDGPDGGDGGGEVPVLERPAQASPVQEPTVDRVPVRSEILPGTVPEVPPAFVHEMPPGT